MTNKEMFWQLSMEELKSGFTESKDYYICLLCGKRIEKGMIYTDEGLLYEAYKYIKIHIAREHGTVFDYLVSLDKKVTGLSDHQSQLLKLFYHGKNDEEIQNHLSIGSKSTIRNHRFVLKEKERQARVFLAIMELLRERDEVLPTDAGIIWAPPGQPGSTVRKGKGEKDKLLRKYFPLGIDGPLKSLNMKNKTRRIVMNEIARRFEPGHFYSEKEINAVLEGINEDVATLRRYLIDYGFLDREADGSRYWLKENIMEKEIAMDRRKELKQQYREMKTEGGVYQIRNTKNNKILIASTPNLKSLNGKRGTLEGGGHYNRTLQEEYKQYGGDAFVFEILETLKEPEGVFFDKRVELGKLEEKWMDKLQPYGERGYHKKK